MEKVDFIPIGNNISTIFFVKINGKQHYLRRADDQEGNVLEYFVSSGLIRLGAVPNTLTGLTPKAIAEVKNKFPHLKLQLRPGLTGQLLIDLDRGAIDAAIVTKPHFMPSGIEFREIAQEPLQLISANEETEENPIKLLKERPFIRFTRSAVLGTLIDN